MRIMIDKGLLLALGAALALAGPHPAALDAVFIAGLLAVVCASALAEWLMGSHHAWIPVCLMSVAAVACPSWVAFMTPVAYDAARARVPESLMDPLRSALRWMWIVPVLRTLVDGDAGTASLTAAAPVAVAVCASFAFGSRASMTERLRSDLNAFEDRARDAARSNRVRLADLSEERDRSVRMATLAERTRIAREIHDNVGHLLTRAIMQVEAGKAVADATNDAMAGRGFDEVGVTLHDAMTMVRRSVHDLEDEGTDFGARIDDAVRSFDGATAGFSVALANGIDSAPAPVARAFATIIRESLTNVVRHSDAPGASVTLRDFPAFWQLVVRDDGPAKARGNHDGNPGGDGGLPRGMGVADIESRARQLGGSATCGPYGGGWRVFVSVPKDRWNDKASWNGKVSGSADQPRRNP